MALPRLTAPPDLWVEAQNFLDQCYHELGQVDKLEERKQQVRDEIATTATYRHTSDELSLGAKMAWRNSNRCIGRLFWRSLKVHDARHIQSSSSAFTVLKDHLQRATNDGKIRPLITIFAPESPREIAPRIWNPQLIRYAGYRQPNGTVVGDPQEVDFTKICQRLGWQGEGSPFDILPLVTHWPNEPVRWFHWPQEDILEVPLTHPDFSWFANLNLRWYALPVISNMILEIGGIRYPAAPFNGWYMGTEIGARNLGDTNRYNQLPVIADRMGLDRSHLKTLWKDQALVELNRAVLFSFENAGVSLVDHHTAAEQFMQFHRTETQQGRCPKADWTWITPPLSGSTTPVFHQDWDNAVLKPNFFYSKAPWSSHQTAPAKTCTFTARE